MNEIQLRKLIREVVESELKNYKSNMLNEMESTTLSFFIVLANTLITLVATGKGKDLLSTPYEIYHKFKSDRKLKKIINRLSQDKEVRIAAKNPKSRGWRNLIASKLTDEEKGYIEGTVWTGSDFRTINRRDFK